MKKFLKLFSIFIFICLSVFVISIISYNTAYNKIATENNSNPEYTMQTATNTSGIVHADTNESINEVFWSNDDENTNIDYYIVRLSGAKLCVYIFRNNAEEFMYDIDMNGKYLSSDEKDMLTQGKILYSKGDLTGFIENYTS